MRLYRALLALLLWDLYFEILLILVLCGDTDDSQILKGNGVTMQPRDALTDRSGLVGIKEEKKKKRS